jgi:hypothetical protein
MLLLGRCRSQQQDFQWLAGTWKLDGKNIYEVWQLSEADKILEGRSFIVKDYDTVVTEMITIQFYNGSFHYIPDVAGDQPPVDFTFTSHNDNSFVAENPKHDFPKLIRYRYVKKDGQERIEAAIEGNGKVIPYSFIKLK